MASRRGNRGWAALAGVAIMMLAAATGSPAQTFETLVDFDGTNGAYPQRAPLVQGVDGNFYGTSYAGGANATCDQPDCGTVFKMTPTGTLTTLYSFCVQTTGCTDGALPYAGLIQAPDGSFYGTTAFGGGNGECSAGSAAIGCGTVFKITPGGDLTTLHIFNGTDGYWPYAGLTLGTEGDFYGTTSSGGSYGDGTVFKMSPAGTLTTLHSFSGQDGYVPYASLVLGTDGNFYGTTSYNDGTVFKITPNGTLKTLHFFNGSDGSTPTGALVQATDGNFYGTTSYGYGTVFEITPSGTLTTLHSFDGSDGQLLYGGLIQATNGNFYGAPYRGGANGDGTVFGLTVGLGPFVETQPTFGKAGTAIKILGTNLTGATSVNFNGTAAVFKVISSTEIGAVVPVGVTSGTVQVVTPSGTLSSNVPFRVAP